MQAARLDERNLVENHEILVTRQKYIFTRNIHEILLTCENINQHA